MRTLFALAAAALVAAPAQAQPISLFNGKDLTGWIGVIGINPGDNRKAEGDVWQVRDGAITCMGNEGAPPGLRTFSTLHTLASYTNFRLQLQFRWLDHGNEGGNSGVFLRSNPPPEGALLTPSMMRMPIAMNYEMQIIGSTPDKPDSGSTGDIWIAGYDQPNFKGERVPPPRPAAAPAPAAGAAPGRGGGAARTPVKGFASARSFPRSKFMEKPRGEWNDYDLSFIGDKLTVKLNGVQVNSASGGPVISGRIGLECEAWPIAFRNIQLAVLK